MTAVKIEKKTRRGGRHSVTTREARTLIKILKSPSWVTALEVLLLTGRTHQIRVHLAGAGHPVVGDEIYGGRQKSLGGIPPLYKTRGIALLKLLPYQFLHAGKLEFEHPVSGKSLSFFAPLPGGLNKILVEADFPQNPFGLENI